MAKTQRVNYGNAIALPVAAGAAHTPADGTTKAADELFPARTYGRRGGWVRNSAVTAMSIIAPSGSIYPLGAGEVVFFGEAGLLEDGAYTITGTAAAIFSYCEFY